MIAIIVEDRDKPDYTVEVSNLQISILRKEMVEQCEIDINFKFINFGTGYCNWLTFNF